MKKFTSVILALCLILSFAVVSSAQTVDLPTYGIQVTGDSATVTKAELQMLLDHSPRVVDMDRFQALKNAETDSVTLTPGDLLYLWLYDGGDDTINDTITHWKNTKVRISFDEGCYSVAGEVAASPSPRGGSGTVTKTDQCEIKDIGSWGGHSAVGLRVTVSAKYEQIWNGGSSGTSEFKSYTTSKSPISGYNLERIDSEDIDQSYGRKPLGEAYFNYRFKGVITGRYSTLAETNA